MQELLLAWVHPRSRGEYLRAEKYMHWWTGSSPLTRGIHRRTHKAIKMVWFIPAHAGNTPCLLSDVQVLEVHPRSRGEYRILATFVPTVMGSSPLTRGIQFFQARKFKICRFIPAHAGNTFVHAITICHFWVHPRSRGEYLKLIF